MADGSGTGETSAASELQFDKAEFAGPAPHATCGRCSRLLDDEYYEAAGTTICSTCATAMRSRGTATETMRALAFGAAAALLGSIVWYAVIKLLDMELGLLAIAVGFLVGLAVRKGSNGRGGARFQAIAIALTYISITASYAPFVLKGLVEAAKTDKTDKTEEAPNGDKSKGAAAKDEGAARRSGGTDQAGSAAPPATATDAGAANEPPTIGGLLLFLGVLLLLAMASPFLAGAKNIIGIIIIAIALYEAWKLNRRIPVQGPFRRAAQPQAVASAG